MHNNHNHNNKNTPTTTTIPPPHHRHDHHYIFLEPVISDWTEPTKNLSLNFKHSTSSFCSSIFVLNSKVKIIWYFTSLFFIHLFNIPILTQIITPFQVFILEKSWQWLEDEKIWQNKQFKFTTQDFAWRFQQKSWTTKVVWERMWIFSVFGQMLYIFAYWLILLRLCILFYLYKLARQ